MQKEIVDLAKQFIAIQSDPENKRELEQILNLALKPLKGFSIERFNDNGVKSALVYNTQKRPKKFKIILNGHLDVIPGKRQQYVPKIKGNKLYGVGSMDMKANLVCLIYAFKEVASKLNYPLALQLVTDEEVGGFHGTKHQIDKGVRADFVIAGEPTNFDVVHQAKGILWVNISSAGKTAHGAYPWRGDNAVWKMNALLNALKKAYPIPQAQKWVTTVNVSKMETSNKAFNKIPDDCVVGLDIRFIPKDANLLVKNIQKLLPKGCELKILTNEPALFTSSSNEYIKLLQKVSQPILKQKLILRGAQGSSDARHFARVGGYGIEFGPIGDGIGSDQEWVDIPSLEKYYKILVNFLLELN